MLKSILLTIIIAINIFPQDSTYQKILLMKDSVSIQNITNHIKNLEYAGGHYSRVTFTPGKDTAAVYIKEQFEKIAGVIVEIDTFYITEADTPYNKKPLYNIIATIPGKVSPEKQFILGAHYDCSGSRMGSDTWKNQWNTLKVPGADDNATGVAAILEIARILTDTTINFYNNYTIKLIAFAAEEGAPVAGNANHSGSKRQARLARENNDQVLGMISVDMIGFNNNSIYTAIVSDEHSSFVGRKIIDAKNLFQIPIMTNAYPFPDATYSDHQSYQDEGFMGVLLIENAPPWNNYILQEDTVYIANPYYHKTGDSTGTVNLDLTAKVTQLALVTAASFSVSLVDIYEEEYSPEEYILAQNFPNPFNPATTIQFNIPSAGKVQLKVYDILGKEAAVLINGEMKKGMHNVEFNGKGLSSGIYIYQLSTESFTSSKKMILMK